MKNGTLHPPRAPDLRNVAELLFFGVASHWEAFCTSVFELEVKQRYRVHQKVALSIMNNVDDAWRKGGGQVSGYAHPGNLTKRANSLLSVRSPFVTFKARLGPSTITYLWHSYKIRNYIAHSGMGKGRKEWKDLLRGLGIPSQQRKGMSAGRLLLDYPTGRPDKWFERLLFNYETIADYILDRSR
jgi:hypothetical protein